MNQHRSSPPPHLASPSSPAAQLPVWISLKKVTLCIYRGWVEAVGRQTFSLEQKGGDKVGEFSDVRFPHAYSFPPGRMWANIGTEKTHKLAPWSRTLQAGQDQLLTSKGNQGLARRSENQDIHIIILSPHWHQSPRTYSVLCSTYSVYFTANAVLPSIVGCTPVSARPLLDMSLLLCRGPAPHWQPASWHARGQTWPGCQGEPGDGCRGWNHVSCAGPVPRRRRLSRPPLPSP